ncbi:metalloregulator ArsR/SmtB family transcription factor [Proteinivorax hydrogeniformans]|uniref:Metalloregulator ArsR/SmtB family transcription factor n=1 Tax=Proteinivorax hydrogeniformans TaxID=1826727 RepID=A0AAU8HVS0_9FIRM
MEKSKIEKCKNKVIHQEAVDKVSKELPIDEELFELSDLFKVFGDTTRIKILFALWRQEMCVCDIAALLDMNQSAISHQLKVLKGAKLVKFRRAGKVVYYSLADRHVEQIFMQGLEHIRE